MGTRLKRLSLLLLLLCCAAGTAAASEIKGQLVLGAYKAPPPDKLPRAGFNWELGNGFKELLKDSLDAERELAVVLLGEGEAPKLERVEGRFYGGSLLPATLVVRIGSTLRVQNEDEIAHELVAEGLDGFGAEATSPRSIRSVNLKTAGNWPLRDRLVSHVRGHLHVLPDLIAVATIADNRFTFSDVAPGTYTLKVFHGPKELVSQKVEVGPKPLSIDPITLMSPDAN